MKKQFPHVPDKFQVLRLNVFSANCYKWKYRTVLYKNKGVQDRVPATYHFLFFCPSTVASTRVIAASAIGGRK